MRPIRLEVQGLTAYHQPVSVDFSDLDLFAITGPTGAGKSSLVDALTYALFGQAPRVGRSIRELISQSEDRLKVSLEFAVNGDRYRIYRESSRKTQKTPQLERFDKDADEWKPEEVDRVRDTNAFIERLLRMDYEAFIRSVLLPQGEFQEFLAGDREQRRRVLDGLLRLGVYGDMQRAANAINARQGDNAKNIRKRLEDELADATPESLKSAKKELKDLEAEAKAAAAARQALESACRIAEALGEALERQKKAAGAKADAEKALQAAQKLLEGGEATLKALDDRTATLRKEIEAAQYDSDVHIRLTKALGLVQQRERIEGNLKGLSDDMAKAKPQIDQLAKAQAEAEKAHADAEKTTAAAHERWEKARTANAAIVVQRSLRTGEPCPVCGQAVHELPTEGKAHELDSLKKAEADAKEAEGKALDRLNKVKRDVAVAEQRLEGLEKQVKATQSERDQCLAELRELGEEKAELRDVKARIRALEDAKAKIETLSAQEKKAAEEREKEAQAITGAQRDAQEKEAEIKAHTNEAREASQQADELTASLRDAAAKNGWDEATRAIESGDPASVLRGRQDEAQRRETELNQAIGTSRNRIEVIAANIEKAKELHEEEKQSREEATLAKDLASLLRADAFPTFIRESALQTLARDGSRRLLEISGGRYDFVVEGQDFLIEDRWNGGERRSVKTLSGGETFLASLALALALAEQLPGLAGDSAAGALESLFIDEGFSNLDGETLDEVASALEMLGQDRSRLIGVITHVPALAERMPARIVVHKTRAGSSVSVE